MVERRCIASGEIKPAEELIRFVCGPDGALVPDLARKLPGRGCWVSCQPDMIERACDKGLFGRHIDTKPVAFAVLYEQLQKLLRMRFVQTLALARRAGLAIGGGGKLSTYDMMDGIIIAHDASIREAKAHKNRLMPQWVHEGFDATLLGSAFGRDSLAYIGVLPDENGKNGGLTMQLRSDIARFAAFLPPLGCQEGADRCITQSSSLLSDKTSSAASGHE